jgi:hypothetical protein
MSRKFPLLLVAMLFGVAKETIFEDIANGGL